MKAFNSREELVKAYQVEFNKTNHGDKAFSLEDVNSNCVRNILKFSLKAKYGIAIESQMTAIVDGFGYVA